MGFEQVGWRRSDLGRRIGGPWLGKSRGADRRVNLDQDIWRGSQSVTPTAVEKKEIHRMEGGMIAVLQVEKMGATVVQASSSIWEFDLNKGKKYAWEHENKNGSGSS
ncbi:hypothetical protein ACLB2K_032729 [Fragaria x ananassa]